MKKKKGTAQHPKPADIAAYAWWGPPTWRLRKRIPETERAFREAETDSSEPWPALHSVPEASCCTTDHWPDAQRWKELPPIQFQAPSVLQEPVKAPALELPEDEGEAGAAAWVVD